MTIETFDFIVVGAGSAGCCLANRLSADPAKRVLLLEAGGKDTNPLIKMPIGFTQLMYDPRTSNLYKTEPEPHLGNRRVSVVRGRVLGGCSAINGMLYMRGQREDYDTWGALPGCEGWSFREILPYFKRSENYLAGDADAFHAKGGELHVTLPSMLYGISDTYIEAAVNAGIPRNADLNGERQEGIGYVQVNQKDGERVSSAHAFLTPDVKKRPNLVIATNALAKRIVLEGKKAVGIEYVVKGRTVRANATREIVLAAGVYNTPPLLELSGIGNPDVLGKLGVDVRHALRGVGENLQDHYQLWVQQAVKTKETLSEDGKFPRVVWSTLRYLFTKKGPLSFPAANIGGFVRSASHGERPIFQIHFTPGAGGMDENGKMIGSKESGVNSTVCIVRPTSRGSVHARDLDPKSEPRILHNYLATEHDRSLAVEGFKLLRKIFATEPFASASTHELIPGTGVTTDAQILEFWKTDGMSVYHPVGSAKMGAASDPDAVVDSELRVHGIEGLRIADASVLPLLPSGNTHAPVVAIAERAADLVLGKPTLAASAA